MSTTTEATSENTCKPTRPKSSRKSAMAATERMTTLAKSYKSPKFIATVRRMPSASRLEKQTPRRAVKRPRSVSTVRSEPTKRSTPNTRSRTAPTKKVQHPVSKARSQGSKVTPRRKSTSAKKGVKRTMKSHRSRSVPRGRGRPRSESRGRGRPRKVTKGHARSRSLSVKAVRKSVKSKTVRSASKSKIVRHRQASRVPTKASRETTSAPQTASAQ